MTDTDTNAIRSALRWVKRVSLRWQICVLTGLSVLISLSVMGYLSFAKSRDVVSDAKLDALMSETRIATGILNRIVTSTREDVVEVPGFPPIPGIMRCLANDGTDPEQEGSTTEIWIQRLDTILNAQMQNRPERVRATVVDRSGKEITYVDRSGTADTSNSARFEPTDVIQKALLRRPGDVVVSDVSAENDGAARSIHFATPYADENGEIHGVFVISLDAHVMFRHAALAVSSGTTDIVNESGKYVFCETNPEYVRSGRDYAMDKPVRAEALAQRGSPDAYRRLIPASERPDGTALIAMYQKFFYDLKDQSRFWAVAPSIDAATALSAIDDIAWRFLWLGLLLSAIVGGVTFVASRGLTGSLAQLQSTADEIAQGNLDAVVPANDASVEVRGLRDSLATMTEHLRTTIESARQQEQQTSAIFNSTADAIVSISEDGRVRSANTAALRLFGTRSEETIGQNISKWVPALHDEHAQYDSTPIHDGEVRTVGDEIEVTGHNNSGKSVPLAMRVTEMGYAGERLYIATLQDITERHQADEERRQVEAEREQTEAERERLFDGIREAVKSLAAASTEILATTTQQASSAQEQAASVTETATTVEELTHTAEESSNRAQEVADSADRAEQVGESGRKAVDETVVAMRHVRQQVESLAENIMALSERAQAISGIIDAVKDIADQTNLLALNAAIEASRAGEHGRGFAVVASEVKALADQSKKATDRVSQILGEIQQATNSAVMATEHGTRSVTEAENVIRDADTTINTLSQTISDAAVSARQILASANQQASAMRQIRDAITHIDQATKQTLSATRQSEQSARDLNNLGDRLNGMIDRTDSVNGND